MATAAPGQAAAGAATAPVFRDEPDVVAKNYPLLVIGVMLASMIQVLDTTITIVAVPHMQSTLGASPETITWVLTSYIIATAVSMPITGWLSNKIGARFLFLCSVAGFIIASMLCGIAQNLEEMVLFRALQGVVGRLHLAAQPVLHARRHQAQQARADHGAVGHGRDHRPDPRPGARRLADRELELALGVLRQPAARHRRLRAAVGQLPKREIPAAALRPRPASC